MVSRRAILTTGAVGVALIGAGAFRLLHSDLSKARQPWRNAGESFGDPRLDALAYAVLAPSPHNRQPWLVRLDVDDDLAMTLFCDLDRLLPETDPPNRQIVIGLGAFLELLRQAAAQAGYRMDAAPFPEGEPQPRLDARPIASIRFVEDARVARDPLFGLALDRRTARVPFDPARPVEAETLNRLDAALRPGDGEFEWVNDAGNVEALKEICRESWRVEIGNPRTHHESVALTRIGEHEINDNPDGISLSGPMIEGFRFTGVLTRDAMNNDQSRAYEEMLNFYLALIDASNAFGWLSTSGNSRTDQLNAGAGWIRLNMAATQAGLAMQPLSQVLQEFPEMAGLYEEFHDFVDVRAPARVQGLFRFGYAAAPPPSPRWPLQSRIVADV
ncbi:MAG: Acg family FMN-binding oxidoreductase [Hyphococcus sp.]